jgi:putative SOS response-associated peptidase YedK
MTTNQDATRRLFKVVNSYVGNLPAFPSIFPDYEAPIVRNGLNGDREMMLMRWGMPSPPQFPGAPITNIRNTNSPHWRRWIKPESRCLVPATSFSEYALAPNPATGKKDVVWSALDHDRPLFAFAGIWTPWTGARGTKAKPVEGNHMLYGYSDHGTERRCPPDPSESDAGHSDHGRRARRMDAGAVGRGQGAAAPIAG